MSTRREFIKQVGIALASMMMVRCQAGDAGQQDGSPTQTPTSTPTRTPTPMPSPTPTPGCASFTATGDSPRERLRSCWQAFGWLAEQSENIECDARTELTASHRAALDALVAAGEVSAVVAEQAQLAFEEAAFHIWRENAPITCYIMEYPLGMYLPASRAQLIQRTTLLAGMAGGGDLDPATVARAQAVLERNIAFLGPTQGGWTAPAELPEEFPRFDELELDVPPEAAEAAAFLINVLTEP